MKSASNPQLDLAFDYVRYTNKHIFLTGKAGTGKTTFLHKVKAEGFKRMVVTAPTGVAAINAGGVTLHSFFQLPFGLYLPGTERSQTQRYGFSKDKISLIRSLELLVIDEISMVRADLLDAVDEVLRRHADPTRPFGGVQLLMIGDLHQLPPVVKQDDWKLLSPHYDTPYFFSSLALKKTDMVSIELQHIYRQSDSRFIELLNKVRDNRIDAQVLATLNSRYRPPAGIPVDSGFITLTSHNAGAIETNSQRLDSLDQPLRRFHAVVEGDFPEIAFPTDATLLFKKGAQVMFVKNDSSPQKRFFNGKLGTVARFGDGEILVRCRDEAAGIPVAPAEWQNIRYSLHPQTKEIQEEQLGTFRQYPLKLAWAITIHKSQGLTFDNIVIDAGAAFAHGQVYVALSRCRTIEGIVLSSKIQPASVKTDRRVSTYTTGIGQSTPDEHHLLEAKRQYQQELVSELFTFSTIHRHLQHLARTFRQHAKALSPEGLSHFATLNSRINSDIIAVTDKFLPQLQTYFAQVELPEDNANLRERIGKAAGYFTPKLHEILSELRNVHLLTDDKSVLKTAQDSLQALQKDLVTRYACFGACAKGFSTPAYLKAKMNADLQFVTERRIAATKLDEVPKDVPNPELYSRLLQWRNETAGNLGLAHREVLRTRSLRELVQLLPATKASLKRIRGIGDMKVSEFGDALIGIIQAYCKENSLAATIPTKPASSGPNTKRVTFDLYKSGKTIEQVAAERGLVTGTIEGHLSYFIARKELDILEFVQKEDVEQISGYFSGAGSISLEQAKAHFGEQYSYGQLRMVLEHFRSQEGVRG